jgi:pimeloyl-ACP methyl ester carboxylesterase
LTESNRVRIEGADIVYDWVGRGPLLLLIAGGNGDGMRYGRLAAHLAGEFTVVSYDRRAECRSNGDATVDLDLAQQARDAKALIQAMGAKSAYVFGNSAGANIGIKLAEDHPEVITALIAHEPPVMSILPDAEEYLRFVDEVHETFLAQGAPAAMRKARPVAGWFRRAQGSAGRSKRRQLRSLLRARLSSHQPLQARPRHHPAQRGPHRDRRRPEQRGRLLRPYGAPHRRASGLSLRRDVGKPLGLRHRARGVCRGIARNPTGDFGHNDFLSDCRLRVHRPGKAGTLTQH